MENVLENVESKDINKVILSGTVANIRKMTFANSMTYNLCDVLIKRKFQNHDEIRVLYDDTYKDNFVEGNKVNLIGRIISKSMPSTTPGDKVETRLEIFVITDTVLDYYKHDFNKIELSGHVFKSPRLRSTDTRKVLDIACAVQDAQFGSMCLPIIVWNDMAEKFSTVPVGQPLSICGRIQSRTYTKDKLQRTVYEISTGTIN